MNQTHSIEGITALHDNVLDPRLATITHPNDVLEHPGLSAAEKRGILAAWASDARSLEGAPALRQIESGAVVHIDDVLDALRWLDKGDRNTGPAHMRAAGERRRGRAHLAARLRGRAIRVGRRDDDDDPPTAPAAMAWPPRRSKVTAYACG
jgi:hypothetical protein